MCMITRGNPKCVGMNDTEQTAESLLEVHINESLTKAPTEIKKSRTTTSRLAIVLVAVLSRPQFILGRTIGLRQTDVASDVVALRSQPSTYASTYNSVDNSLAAWEQMKESTGADFRHRAISDLSLPGVNLEAYFDRYLSDGAPHSIAWYLMQSGDSDLETSAWQFIDVVEGGSAAAARSIHYIHPVNNPMAPPTARATKRQAYTAFGGHGMVIETQTEVIGVPKTDCFVVEDRILLEPKHGGGGVMLTAWFDIRFTKKTVFRSIIEKATSGEFHDWFRGYDEMIRKSYPMSSKSYQTIQLDPTQRFPTQSRLPWLSFITNKSY